MSDLISRQAAIDMIEKYFDGLPIAVHHDMLAMIHRLPTVQPEPLTLRVNRELTKEEYDKLIHDIKDAPIVLLPSAQPEPSQVARDIATIIENEQDMMVIERNAQQWIPCSERLPEDFEEVNVTWINTDPEPYYDFVKGKPFTGTAVFYKGRWFWYSAVCTDYLREYGFSPNDLMDDGIKVVAWQPIPEPWKGEDDERA